MVRHNNEVPNQHFRKEWQLRVRTWFKQAKQKKRRRLAREAQAAKIAPRPVDGALRPVVHCQTVRYHSRVKKGRGFTLEELKEAGIGKKYARTVGIAVDHRRKNKSVESLQANVQRLQEYKSKLIIFPRKPGTTKGGDSTAEEVALASQLKGELMPIVKETTPIESRAITAEDKAFNAYAKLRLERMNKNQKGIREKRAKEKEDEK